MRHAAFVANLVFRCDAVTQRFFDFGDERRAAQGVGEITNLSAKVAILNAKHATDAFRVASDPEVSVEEDRAYLRAFEQVADVRRELLKLFNLRLVLGVDRVELLVHRVKLFVRTLKLLVRGDELLVRGLKLLVTGFELLDGGLENFPSVRELALEGLHALARRLGHADLAFRMGDRESARERLGREFRDGRVLERISSNVTSTWLWSLRGWWTISSRSL